MNSLKVLLLNAICWNSEKVETVDIWIRIYRTSRLRGLVGVTKTTNSALLAYMACRIVPYSLPLPFVLFLSNLISEARGCLIKLPRPISLYFGGRFTCAWRPLNLH